MKKVLILIIVCLPVFVIGQATYNIKGLSVNTTFGNIANPARIYKTDMKIKITDSSFITTEKGKETSYPIVKKVSQNNFVISDGLREMKITIGKLNTKKYSGFITQESDKAIVSCYF